MRKTFQSTRYFCPSCQQRPPGVVEVFSGNRLDTAWTNRVSKGMYSLAAYTPGLRVVSQGDKLSERCMMRVINVITLNWMSLQ